MRIVRFFADEKNIHLGVRQGDNVIDLGPRSPISLMSDASPIHGPKLARNGLKLDAPIRDAPKLLALAGNYRKHIVEAGMAAPEARALITPQVFLKPPSTCINAPGGEIRIVPANVFVDWEIELAVIIGRRGRQIAARDAMSYVFGYTIVNDVSDRRFNSRLQNRTLREFDPFFDWLMGKWFDGFAPIGPEIVTADEVPDPHHLGIRLFVNDELMQDSNTSFMIFSVPEAIEYISSVVTLEPGDIIAMGTPEGTGAARGICLKPGDRLRGEIDGLGVLDTSIARDDSNE